MRLEEVAQVIIGVLSKRENDSNGENSYELFSLKNKETLRTNKNLSDKLAQKGDLLFRLLSPNKIIYVEKKFLCPINPIVELVTISPKIIFCIGS